MSEKSPPPDELPFAVTAVARSATGRRLDDTPDPQAPKGEPSAQADKKWIDPVCGMTVGADPARMLEHGTVKYYFCCQGCLAKFRAAPENFLQPPAASPAESAPERGESTPPSSDARVTYTCPMHPQIEQQGPGTCPICGMALEPKSIGLESDSSELDDMTRRFGVGAVFTGGLLVVSMGAQYLPMALGARAEGLAELVLAAPVVFWAGLPLFERAWSSIVGWRLNMFTLIGLGVGSAVGLSLIALAVPELLPAAFKEHGVAPLYFEPAAMIVTLVLLGQVLELRARRRTGDAVRGLLALTPDTARRVAEDGTEEAVAIDRVVAGDRLRARPGDRLAVDGTVLEGSSSVDESMLTGEAVAVEKNAGDPVRAGTLNQNGSILYRADAVGEATLLARIVALANQASRSRAPVQKLADTVSAWFVPGVMLAAGVAFLCWVMLGPEPRFAHGFVAMVSVLIIACPCALGLATPLSIVVGVGRGAKSGILFKDAEALEQLEAITVLVVDKTGTLTEGKPAVDRLTLGTAQDEGSVLGVALSLAALSEHPLSRAIAAYARAHGAPSGPVDDFLAQPGSGATGRQNGATIAIGNLKLMRQLKVSETGLNEQGSGFAESSASLVYIARAGALLGAVNLVDPIRAGCKAALDAVRGLGVRVVLASGDREASVRAVATALGIDEFHGDMLPEDKFRLVRELQAGGARVAFAGDGINDAVGLAQADVGIAMGTGADIAIESAAVVLVKGDLAAIARARKLSRSTMANIRQNLTFAFAYNLLGVPVAAGALYPWWGLLLSPMIAGAAMSLSSVSVIANALRLRVLKL